MPAISSEENYDYRFFTLKTQSEVHPINFNSDEGSHPYNLPISLTELHLTIHKNLRNDHEESTILKNLYSHSYRLFEEKYGIAFVRRSTVGVGGQFCGRFRLLGIQKY